MKRLTFLFAVALLGSSSLFLGSSNNDVTAGIKQTATTNSGEKPIEELWEEDEETYEEEVHEYYYYAGPNDSRIN